jgi:type VI protein secretion system component Hcp
MKAFSFIAVVCLCSNAAFAVGTPKPSSRSPRIYIMMKHGKLIEVNNGHKKPVKKDVYLVNESTIHTDGSIDAGSGQSIKLKEGEYITMDGRIRKLKDMAHPEAAPVVARHHAKTSTRGSTKASVKVNVKERTGGSFKAEGPDANAEGSLTEASMIFHLTRKESLVKKHAPLTISRKADAASPQLLQWCSNKEKLNKIAFTVYKQGDSSRFKVVTLDDAVISGIRVTKPGKLAGGSHTDELAEEKVTLQYRNLSVVYYQGSNISDADNWTVKNK